AGRIVESGPAEELFRRPRHPHTAALLAATPRLDAPPRRLAAIDGQPPDLRQELTACPFAPRKTVALVGESASGKTLTSRTAPGLLPPGATAEGRVRAPGEDVLTMGLDPLRALRTSRHTMVLQ
ncbi:hypothetical protein VM98_34410, partial [Streptomyces rubellomurinus subsp. indigoferus]